LHSATSKVRVPSEELQSKRRIVMEPTSGSRISRKVRPSEEQQEEIPLSSPRPQHLVHPSEDEEFLRRKEAVDSLFAPWLPSSLITLDPKDEKKSVAAI
jgi:hypothetical protein